MFQLNKLYVYGLVVGWLLLYHLLPQHEIILPWYAMSLDNTVLENPRFCAEAQLSQHRGVADPLHSFRWSREIFYACCTFGTSIPGPCPGSSQPYSSSITAHGMLYSATWKEYVGTEFMGFETLLRMNSHLDTCNCTSFCWRSSASTTIQRSISLTDHRYLGYGRQMSGLSQGASRACHTRWNLGSTEMSLRLVFPVLVLVHWNACLPTK